MGIANSGEGTLHQIRVHPAEVYPAGVCYVFLSAC
jgi:hypothetical protein